MEAGGAVEGEWREWAMGVSVSWAAAFSIRSKRKVSGIKLLLHHKLGRLNDPYEWSDVLDGWEQNGREIVARLSAHVTISSREFWCDDAVSAASDQLGIHVPGNARCEVTYYEMDNGTSPRGYWQA
jgi:hypothetical protein